MNWVNWPNGEDVSEAGFAQDIYPRFAKIVNAEYDEDEQAAYRMVMDVSWPYSS